jgi:release factor glutamine methyltransferase
MTYKEQLVICIQQIEKLYAKNEAENIAVLLVDKYTNSFGINSLEKESLIIQPSHIKLINTAIEQLLTNKPIQYILKEAWFYKYAFKVTNSVLIPRPETEELVYETIKIIKEKNIKNPIILEVGTGSGCIAICLKKELPNATIIAIDISEDALIIAKENANELNVHIDFVQQDFLNENNWINLPKQVDYIIINPPYIAKKEKINMLPNVLDYEPQLALFVEDANALIFYKKILSFAQQLNNKPIICCEINEHLGMETKAVFTNFYEDVILKKDMQQKDRMIIAKP